MPDKSRPEETDETPRPHEVPGSSSPGQPGYEGQVQVGDEIEPDSSVPEQQGDSPA